MAQSRARVQVDPILSNRIQAKETLRPAAAPVNSYFPANVPRPVINEFLNLEPLSSTVSGILGNINDARKQSEREALLGAAADPANLEALDVGKAVSKAVNQDGVPISQSPYHYPEAKRLAGTWLARKYYSEMLKRWDEYTLVETADGEPVGGARPKSTYQEVANAVRSQIAAESNIYRDTLSRGAFNQAILELDGKLIIEATVAEQKSRDAFVKDSLLQELGTALEEIGNTGWDAQARQFVQDWDRDKTRDRPSVTNRESMDIIMRSAFSTAAKLASERRYDEAALFLQEFGEVRIGGVAIKDNRAVYGQSDYQTELESQIAAMENRAEADADRKVRDYGISIQEAYNQEIETWAPLVNTMLAETPGVNPVDALVYNTVFDGIRSRHESGVAEAVIQQIRQVLSAGYNQPRSDSADRDLAEMSAQGDWQSMDAYLTARGSDIATGQYMHWLGKQQELRVAASRLDTIPEYRATFEELDRSFQALPLFEVTDEFRAILGEEFVRQTQQLRSDVGALSAGSQTEEGRQEIIQRVRDGARSIQESLTKRVMEYNQGRQAFLSGLSEAVDTNQPVDRILQDVENQPFMTRADRELLREESQKQSERISSLMANSYAQQKIEELVYSARQEIETTTGEPAGVQGVAESKAIRDAFNSELRAKLIERLPGTRRGREVADLLIPTVDEVMDTVLKGLGADLGAVERVAEGAGAEALAEAAAEAASDETFQWWMEGILNHAAPQATPEGLRLGILPKDAQLTINSYFSAKSASARSAAREKLSTQIGVLLDERDGVPSRRGLSVETPPAADRAFVDLQVQTAATIVGMSPESILEGVGQFQEARPRVVYDELRTLYGRSPLKVERGGARKAKQTLEEIEAALAAAEKYLTSRLVTVRGAGDTRMGIDTVRRVLAPRPFSLDLSTLNPHVAVRFQSEAHLREWQADGRWDQLIEVLQIQDVDNFENAMLFRIYNQ